MMGKQGNISYLPMTNPISIPSMDVFLIHLVVLPNSCSNSYHVIFGKAYFFSKRRYANLHNTFPFFLGNMDGHAHHPNHRMAIPFLTHPMQATMFCWLRPTQRTYVIPFLWMLVIFLRCGIHMNIHTPCFRTGFTLLWSHVFYYPIIDIIVDILLYPMFFYIQSLI